MHQPAAEGDAVCLVVEFFRIDLGEGLQLRFLQNLRVEAGNAVDGEAVVNVHVGHVYQAVLIQDCHLGVGILLLHPLVQLLDDGYQLRHSLLQIVQRPLLQGLRQNGVVGVGAGLGHGLDGVVQADAPLGEQADQLWDYHGGMGVVNLDDGVLVQVLQGTALVLQVLQNQLGRGADHKILLVHPQQPSRPVAVVGIEEQGQVMKNVRLVKVNALTYQGFVHGFQVEETKLVHAAFIAGNVQVIEHGLSLSLGEGYGKGHSRGLQPAFWREPGVWPFLLLVVLEELMEQAKVVQQPHAVPRQAQGGGGVQIAGGQAAQAPIAQGRLGFHLFHSGEVLAGFGQGLLHLVVDSQVNQVVGKQLSHQKLRGDVIELFLPGNLFGGGKLFLNKLQQGQVNLLVVRCQQALGKPQAHLLFQFITHPHGGYLLLHAPGRKWW